MEIASLPAYRVTYANGTSYVTSMAAHVTLADARDYFVGESFEQPDGSTLQVVAVDPDLSDYVGRFARSIETGWLGQVVEIVEGDAPLKMQGVNQLCLTVAGGRPEDWIDDDDTQWFAVADVKFLAE